MPRFLTIVRLDENNVPEGGFSPEMGERMGALLKEITEAGVMLDTGGLTPTSQGRRVTFSGGKLSATDGPFTETKEVVGGYSIVQAKDLAEAEEWAGRFLKVHDDTWTVTCEIRQIADH
ncbi:YciI family protein [Streptomyces qinzhouensis]|uniref:Transcriptional regulator n=1 Tax=Streptomyces qinzhouensis TaxID=2599401 RepID=A0A5B8JM02_9ACTN|nr:YciI family protein [Streptomyces qinzhouensis]QDY78573.1 transcriptional regulator [Streptomyces qinzhouensis]